MTLYTHGHHESVLRSHRWRTAANSAAYLLPHLVAGQRLLDVGCGPGTITADFARLVAPGQVVGIDQAEVAVAAAAAAYDNLRFQTGNVYDLAFADGSFDVVHAHQVLQHLDNPVAALQEMARGLAWPRRSLGTATTRRSRGTRPTTGSIAGWPSTATWPGATAASPTPAATSWRGPMPPGSPTSPPAPTSAW